MGYHCFRDKETGSEKVENLLKVMGEGRGRSQPRPESGLGALREIWVVPPPGVARPELAGGWGWQLWGGCVWKSPAPLGSLSCGAGNWRLARQMHQGGRLGRYGFPGFTCRIDLRSLYYSECFHFVTWIFFLR